MDKNDTTSTYKGKAKANDTEISDLQSHHELERDFFGTTTGISGDGSISKTRHRYSSYQSHEITATGSPESLLNNRMSLPNLSTIDSQFQVAKFSEKDVVSDIIGATYNENILPSASISHSYASGSSSSQQLAQEDVHDHDDDDDDGNDNNERAGLSRVLRTQQFIQGGKISKKVFKFDLSSALKKLTKPNLDNMDKELQYYLLTSSNKLEHLFNNIDNYEDLDDPNYQDAIKILTRETGSKFKAAWKLIKKEHPKTHVFTVSKLFLIKKSRGKRVPGTSFLKIFIYFVLVHLHPTHYQALESGVEAGTVTEYKKSDIELTMTMGKFIVCELARECRNHNNNNDDNGGGNVAEQDYYSKGALVNVLTRIYKIFYTLSNNLGLSAQKNKEPAYYMMRYVKENRVEDLENFETSMAMKALKSFASVEIYDEVIALRNRNISSSSLQSILN
ncbi:hypothetical protein H4219_002037 [Mycoemilia scoparia]|uniref:Uncharacterized protein n=1 Tax=Mycoemilia scoparia TaxID=417184 RepID=A0A9W8DPM9_9FUNG|nr:hypothetical protein H4219_002037 [Mycoemilia scoparia]